MFGLKKKAEIKCKFCWGYREDLGHYLQHYTYYETNINIFRDTAEEVPVISHAILFRSLDQIKRFYEWLQNKDPKFELDEGSYITKTTESGAEHLGAFKLEYRSATCNLYSLDNLESLLKATKDVISSIEREKQVAR